jgi:hypothetical protein
MHTMTIFQSRNMKQTNQHFFRLIVFLVAIGGLSAQPKDHAAGIALARVRTGDVQAAAEALSARNSAEKDTLTWYQQSALELVQLAHVRGAMLDYDGAAEAAHAALAILEHGRRRPHNNRRSPTRSQTYAESAMIAEELLGDRELAKQFLGLALADAPENMVAKGRSDRLKAADEKDPRGGRK